MRNRHAAAPPPSSPHPEADIFASQNHQTATPVFHIHRPLKGAEYTVGSMSSSLRAKHLLRTRCGREDSNLHGHSPTRSLGETGSSQSLATSRRRTWRTRGCGTQSRHLRREGAHEVTGSRVRKPKSRVISVRIDEDDLARLDALAQQTSRSRGAFIWMRYPYQAQTENVFSDSSSSAKPSEPDRSSRSTGRNGGGFRRPRTPAPGIISSPPELPSTMLARFAL